MVTVFYTIKVASMQWLFRVVGVILPTDPAQLPVELELVDVSVEVADISNITSHMIFCPWVKQGFISCRRRCNT